MLKIYRGGGTSPEQKNHTLGEKLLTLEQAKYIVDFKKNENEYIKRELNKKAEQSEVTQIKEDLSNIMNPKSPQLLDKSAFLPDTFLETAYGTAKIDDTKSYANMTLLNPVYLDSGGTVAFNVPKGSTLLTYWKNENGDYVRIGYLTVGTSSGITSVDGHWEYSLATESSRPEGAIRIAVATKAYTYDFVMTIASEWDETATEYIQNPTLKIAENSISEDKLDVNVRNKLNRTIESTDFLKGKKVVGVGDSIMIGVGDGEGGFLSVIGTYEDDITIVNMGVGSTTIQQNSNVPTNISSKCIYDRIDDIPSDADVIILEGGINDFFHQEQYGCSFGSYEENLEKMPISAKYADGTYSTVNKVFGYGSTDFATLNTATFCGAFESALVKLITRFYDKVVLVVIPHNPRGTNDIWQYFDTEEVLCRKYGVPYINIGREYGMMPRIKSIACDTESALTVDEVHPNRLGYELKYAPQIYAKLKELMH